MGDFLANITILDPKIFTEKESMNLPLEEYVQYISKLNSERLDLPILKSRPIGGISGYTTSIRSSFKDERGGNIFTDNFKVHAFIFIEHNNLKYQLEIPENLGHRGQQIISSLEFF
jgi:hypothetical protein